MTFTGVSVWLGTHGWWTTLLVFFASVVPRVVLTLRSDPSHLIALNDDAATYLTPAQNLLSLGVFLNWQGLPEINRTPGYPIFLAGIMYVVGQDLVTVFIVQTVILSFQVVVLYWLAKRLLPSLTAFIAALIAAFSPWGAAFAGFPLPEGLFLFLLVLIFLLMRVTAETRNRALALVGGTMTGLLTAGLVLVRPISPLVLLVSGLFCFLYGAKRQGVWLLLIIMMVASIAPLYFWKVRNQSVAQFDGISDVASICPFHYLAVRINAHLTDQDRFILSRKSQKEEGTWNLSAQQADEERWRRAFVVFKEHPILTLFYFVWNAAEHVFHPSPNVLSAANLNFRGDYWVLAVLWGGLLTLSLVGLRQLLDGDFDHAETDRKWLLGVTVVCLLITLSSGVCFGAGSRLRMPLELIIPLLAGTGLVHVSFQLYRRMV